jgi:cell division protease FtsH
MVGRWGMSDAVGPVVVLPAEGQATLFSSPNETSEHTHRRVDAEVRRIVERAHAEVTALLREHWEQLDALAAALIEHETLDEPEAYAAAGIDHPDEPLVLTAA